MKHLILIAALLLSLPGLADDGHKKAPKATCSGNRYCTACKNCRYCQHCAKSGGTCGVCTSYTPVKKATVRKAKKRVRG